MSDLPRRGRFFCVSGSKSGFRGDHQIMTRHMKTMKYEVIIYRSEDEEAFIAEVPELPSCAAEGQSH